jgi:hypothetical protein
MEPKIRLDVCTCTFSVLQMIFWVSDSSGQPVRSNDTNVEVVTSFAFHVPVSDVNVSKMGDLIEYKPSSFMRVMMDGLVNITTDRTTGESKSDYYVHQSGGVPSTELPLPFIITSAYVAVFIFVLATVAYYWHATQLDARACQLAIELVISELPDISIEEEIVTKGQKARRMSIKTPRVPAPGSKRGSTRSSLSDKDVLASAPRRQSMFILWRHSMCILWRNSSCTGYNVNISDK